MKRKIIKNKHQYKVNLPIELIRKLNWDKNTSIRFHEVQTPLGKGMLIIKDNKKDVLKLEVKK
ncbi:hypothetical protein KY342_00515 [Candidatus Woesearchaeota archaeon]|nr:hypothetical protein [Candidatus Woesearchaeota archaeon]